MQAITHQLNTKCIIMNIIIDAHVQSALFYAYVSLFWGWKCNIPIFVTELPIRLG